MSHLAADLDWINRRAYRRGGFQRDYASTSGWLESGEEAALTSVAETARGAPILDIGVGGGRTVPLMRAISEDYRGIDYVPTMVALARQRYPGIDFLEMDARHLDFADCSFALVAFSYNGIDSVDPVGRRLILREVHRVLRSSGYFVFSGLNRTVTAGRAHWPDWSVFHGTGRHPRRLLWACAKQVDGAVNRLCGLLAAQDDGDVAIGNLPGHNFALVTVFMSLAAELRELREAGFGVEAIFDPDGRRIPLEGISDSVALWHHFVVRKPP